MHRRAAHFVLPVLCAILLVVPARLWAADAPKDSFMRFVDDNDGGGKLQTAITTYRNADGVTVHLVGAVHVGEAGYYQGLNKTFATYDALLYELIKPKDSAVPSPNAPSNSLLSMFQRFLKDMLDLTFQLDQINYGAKNFIHADLDAETFAKMQEERGESFLTLMLRQILNEMANPRTNQPDISLPEILVALTSPDRARHFKLILGRQFEDIETRMAGFEGPDGSVLVTERNKAAIKVLQTTIAAGKKNIGIFYGAAHMKDMEKRVVELGFKKTGVEWRTAWDMTPREGDIIIKTVKRSRPRSPLSPDDR